MTTNEIREKYLKFFESKGHKIIYHAPLVNDNPEEAGTMFTPFGMQQMVPYLLGKKHSLGNRLVDSQPCIRVDDIEEVGDNRHTTFFEMLGNWSLGDYFKEDQLKWFFQFLVDKNHGLGLDPYKIYISVFEGDKDFKIKKNERLEELSKDKDSIEIWKTLFESVGINAEEGDRIRVYPAKKNWWSMHGTPQNMPIGDIGGPDSEVFYDFGKELNLHENSPYKDEECHPNCDCGRFLEIGNSVFIQYQKVGENIFEELPNKNVDFGGGLERIAAAVNNDPDVFRIDVFEDLINLLEVGMGKKYADDKPSYRVIVDHLRAATFMADSGVVPSNKLQGYIMRRLVRRAILKARRLDGGVIEPNIFTNLVKDVFTTYKEVYFSNSDLKQLQRVIFDEVQKFIKTLDRGLGEFQKLENVDGKIAFDLFQTYGFPLELTLELAQEKGQKVDIEEFKKAFEEHQDKSRSASAGTFKGGLADHSIEVTRLHTAHHLLLASLQQLIDPNISQKGSNITNERLRIDFNFERKLTDEEISKLEGLINEKIDKDLPVTKKVMSKEEAEKIGAQMEFSKKYPDQVSVYFVGDENDAFSKEFCGGPHVTHLAEIGGHVKITKQESAGAGIRRLYATVTAK